ncbi:MULTISPECIES: bifunctional diaminohydroxyphosphoribosylaminopyrimidine deaminase/5-amino-6-(5-phosphoribosylamino)uracil reductase RibD [unclassified Mucilaginibacter]|uniref:bifunctional diaminohydroxyphosphoribosylaminopyrimidine deaminase/5-amino-6-(5-phosphoribosylamino)uracil reductase RibD n=1 Tax=unclassified Mucilaginibacter TaxID=2617802 RepID=UPI002AC95888|nr:MULTISPECIES: bifunctional diaminohydroxyphosphoribosylaminopyrimidine deaminase/5-amino-6-(5-phosphoribosylamino)uracil reductase RibD [unclassified Mucilaginibacter]MEB0249424.1 bifunctional diaminohydroxyphosphoribosylaminopyrimidine deaminase/5-amino-6-(5-phosphoribosylamino)uracil reductase RibD [Mucilaginibacter sp. 5B2]MEB0260829.1 bifunctional diaminohydroxyphosphoribosylaminopyrimidine deaminase/5-amino-6-(5-phosphoribosylamino)uracil reductase RibD [Mucilaginibacter sp. 10I4]MEB0279
MALHDIYMQRCLELAALGAGKVSPNPMVGAVIVCEGKIIGEGYHQKYGEAHAEVNAIKMLTDRYDNYFDLLQQSTIYVSLEPCAHYGKTPPCADLIIKHHIPNVVIGCRDPFAQVDGKGIEKLQAAGVAVIVGVLEKECQWLNRRFFTRVQKQRPYIILKWAQTADGFFAPTDGSQHWITGLESRKLVHQWRAEEDAILVGKNTILADNPQLNVRYAEGRSPKRVVIDRRLELSNTLNVFDQSVETLIFNEVKFDIDGKNKYIALEDFDRYVPQYILFQLYLQDIQSVIIEGGAHTLNSFIDAGLWDEARIFTGASVLQTGIKAPMVTVIKISEQTIGADNLQIITNTPT